MIDYDSFSHCHLTDIFFRGSERVKGGLKNGKIEPIVIFYPNTLWSLRVN